jgi:peptidoglycan/LPS O-acetylase OafA/YrhL
MRTHYAGMILLALGFAMLVGMVLIWDPVTPDANIGAGILATLGVPVGALGLALLVAHGALRVWERARERDALADPAISQD